MFFFPGWWINNVNYTIANTMLMHVLALGATECILATFFNCPVYLSRTILLILDIMLSVLQPANAQSIEGRCRMIRTFTKYIVRYTNMKDCTISECLV